MRTIYLTITSFIGFLVFAITALLLVNLLPNSAIEKNLIRTARAENYSPHPLFSHTKMDWWTECELMTAGIYRETDTSVARSFKYRDGSDYRLASDTMFAAWRSAVLSPNIGNCELLHQGSSGKLYFRYWLGGQILTRPLLYLSGVGAIRLFIAAMFFASLATFTVWVKRRGGTRLAVASVLLIAVAPMFSQFIILPHASAWIIGFLASSLLMKWGTLSNQQAVLLGLWSGMILAFFDMLNNPIVVPMAMTFGYFVICYARTQPPSVLTLLLLNAAWFAGYTTFWVAKWMLAAIELGTEAVIANVTGKVGERTSLEATAETTWRTGLINNGLSMIVPMLVFIGLAVRQTAVGFANHRHGNQGALSGPLARSFTVLPLAFSTLPILWIALLSNHSAIHYFFVAPILIWSAILWFFAVFVVTEPNQASCCNATE
jgi:hypothetical protein